MTRRTIAIGALLVLVALAGCTSLFGPGEPDPQRLNESANYTWDSDVAASITVEKNSFEGVYSVDNRSELEVYKRDALGQESNLRVSGLKYRYANGTVVNNSAPAVAASQTRDRTILEVPNESGGQVAFSAPRQGKQFRTPVFVQGPTNLTLPNGTRVGIPLLSNVSPQADNRSVTNDRMTLQYENLTTQNMNVRYYLQRDLLIFGSLLIGAIVFGAGGGLYYWRQIRQLRRRREETAIDIDTEGDDFGDDGPPPGMQ
jgi:hypothetical protein